MATKNFTQFNTATPLTTSDFIVGYNAAGTAEIKAQVQSVLNLINDSDAQTLSFNEIDNNLTISPGNTVSLSSLSDKTIVNSVSSLLTPLVLTNTLTGQLVTNTDFNSYKTDVANTTASGISYVHTNFLPLSGGIVNELTINGNTSIVGILTASNFKVPNTTSVGIGNQTLLVNIGGNNTAIGYSALQGNTTGGSNSAFGLNALSANLVGGDNVALGVNALRDNINSFNTAVGSQAITQNTTGQQNVGFGVNALNSNITGSFNTAIGTNSLISNTGDYNTAIGAGTNIAAGINNSIAIGAGATPIATGEIAIGSSSIPLNTAATAGAIALYLQVRINGTLYKLPLYNV